MQFSGLLEELMKMKLFRRTSSSRTSSSRTSSSRSSSRFLSRLYKYKQF